MQTLLIATRNAHKTREIGQMLGSGWHVSDLVSLPRGPAVKETGMTFEENAVLKALAISRFFTGLVLAEDSGLEVDVLGGAPGVRSARFAGEQGDDAANRRALIQRLRSLEGSEFAARFRCVMVIATQGELLGSFEGTVEGKVILEERGPEGFGYDCMFVPRGYSETFGELQPEIKNSLSHRGRALAQALEFLRS
jgi:XTP/dITP diphosphohydrolase